MIKAFNDAYLTFDGHHIFPLMVPGGLDMDQMIEKKLQLDKRVDEPLNAHADGEGVNMIAQLFGGVFELGLLGTKFDGWKRDGFYCEVCFLKFMEEHRASWTKVWKQKHV